MVKPNKRVATCTGFEWDRGNDRKNWDRHGVSNRECEQVFFNKPLIIRRDKAHSMIENRYFALGRTNMGRLLVAAFTIRNDKIRIISAQDMTEAEMERYPR